MKPKIVITFDPESGNPSIGAEGLNGKSCHAFTKEFEQALGQTTGDTLTPDYHKLPAVGQAIGQTIGHAAAKKGGQRATH